MAARRRAKKQNSRRKGRVGAPTKAAKATAGQKSTKAPTPRKGSSPLRRSPAPRKSSAPTRAAVEPATAAPARPLKARRGPATAHRRAPEFPGPDATPPLEAASVRVAGATPPPVMGPPTLPIAGVDPDATPPPLPTEPTFYSPPGATPHGLSAAPPALPPPAQDEPPPSQTPPGPGPDATPPMNDLARDPEAHATPPILVGDEAIMVAPPAVFDVAASASAAVALVRAADALEPGFAAWEDLRADEKVALRAIDEELRRIDEQGTLFLGAMRSALETRGATDALASRADETLAAARAELLRQRALVSAAMREANQVIRAELAGRVERRARLAKPAVRLMVRALPEGRRILHLERPSPDDAVVLLQVLSGRIPSRFGYLFDDSVEALHEPPALFFAEEGVDAPAPRSADGCWRALAALDAVWPVKAVLPQPIDGGLVVWRTRGAVLEAELGDGPNFRNCLTEAEAERVVARMLALKFEGRLELELGRG